MNCSLIVRRIVLAAAFLAIALLMGCAVLTPSQVKEVQTFGKAAENCAELPASVMTAYAEVLKTRNLMDAAVSPDTKKALPHFNDAQQEKLRHEKEAKKANAAISILKDYGNLLATLASDSFTEGTAESAIRFAKAIDGATGEYNKLTESSLPTIGNTVAAILRGGLGMYIKRQQHIAIKEAVEKGNEYVGPVSKTMTALIDLYVPKENVSLSILGMQKSDLETTYESYVNAHGPRQIIYDVRFFHEQIMAVDQTIALANKARKAADNLTQAQQSLSDAIMHKQTLGNIIEQVEVFQGEVEAAMAIKNKLESGGK